MSTRPGREGQPAPFAVFARLYEVAEPGIPTTVIEASDAWGVDALARPLDGPTIWGRLPNRGAGGLGQFVRRALRRERALRQLQRRHGSDVRAVRRLRPSASTMGGPVRPRLRRVLRSGLLVELGAHGYDRILDRVLGEAGVPAQEPVVLPRADGAALGMLQLVDGAGGVLRAMTVGGSGYPGMNADALAALEGAGVTDVPRLVARGTTFGVSWMVESRQPGVRPDRLDEGLIGQIGRFLATLPQQPRVSWFPDRMGALAERFPRWSSLLTQLGHTTVDAPGILQHGDLWRGNLLVRDGRLSGVIDWDTWHAAGLPGVDLLQLLVMERRGRTRASVGTLWKAAPWRSSEFLDAGRQYFAALGVEVTPQLLDGIGLAWWASQVLRHDHQAWRPAWVEENVDAVLASIGGSP